jgi:excisionase family DNA binding protein
MTVGVRAPGSIVTTVIRPSLVLRPSDQRLRPSGDAGDGRDGRPSIPSDERTRIVPRHLTVAEVCEELDVARSTFNDWRAKGRAPKCIKLPNGSLRIRRAELDRWLASHEGV